MSKKTNILVVGAGAQGSPCVAILARQPSVGRILLGTREAAKAFELFGTANVAVAYAAAAGALQLTEGNTKAGIVWPEELDAARFIALANTLGLTLNLTAS